MSNRVGPTMMPILSQTYIMKNKPQRPLEMRTCRHEENSNIESLSETVSEEDSKSITEQDTTGTEMPLVETQPVSATGWTLPVRAAPLLFQFHNEEVSEFPLQQTKDGRESVSLVVDDDLLRIIETRLDPDGQRRMKVCLSMKRRYHRIQTSPQSVVA